MKKMIALVLAIMAILTAAVAGADAVFTAPANSKGFNTLDPDKKTPNRVYNGAGDPLNLAKAMDQDGFVLKEAGSDAVLPEYIRTFAVSNIYMVLDNGERVLVAEEAMQDLLDLIRSRTVRTLKKGKTEGVSLNVEPYKKAVHTPTYEIYFVGVEGGKHLTEFVRQDGTYTFCTRKSGKKSGGSSTKPSNPDPTSKPADPTPTPKPEDPTPTPTAKPTNTPNPEHDPVVLPPFEPTPAPAVTPDPKHDEVVLPVFEATPAPKAEAPANTPAPKHDEVVLPVFSAEAAPAPKAVQEEVVTTSTQTTVSEVVVEAAPQVEVEQEQPIVSEPVQQPAQEESQDSRDNTPDPGHDTVVLPWD